jgi:hypothetical protein
MIRVSLDLQETNQLVRAVDHVGPVAERLNRSADHSDTAADAQLIHKA